MCVPNPLVNSSKNSDPFHVSFSHSFSERLRNHSCLLSEKEEDLMESYRILDCIHSYSSVIKEEELLEPQADLKTATLILTLLSQKRRNC
jgi:hypothetical protein